jgi:hypothetical protein
LFSYIYPFPAQFGEDGMWTSADRSVLTFQYNPNLGLYFFSKHLAVS